MNATKSKMRPTAKRSASENRAQRAAAHTAADTLKVYMSFAPPDASIAEELKQLLEETKRFHIVPLEQSQQWHSGTWDVALAHRLIAYCDAFLAIFTQHSLLNEYRSWLDYEYGFAVFVANQKQEPKIQLVRAVVEDPVPDSVGLPATLLSFKTVDWRDPHSHELALDKLIAALTSEDRGLTLQERQQIVYQEAMSPNPRREMFARVLGNEFAKAFRSHVGPLEDKIKRLSDLQRAQDNLMTPEIISIEEANAFDDIWVVSHSLHNDLHDEKIQASIQKNLGNGIRYTYFVPRTPLIMRRKRRFEEVYGKFSSPPGKAGSTSKEERGGYFRFIFLDAGVFMPFDELVVYDGESATDRWGYIQMNYDRPTGADNSTGLVMRVPDRTLSTIIEFLGPMSREATKAELRADEQVDGAT